MNAAIYHLAGGDAFFAGVALMLISTLVQPRTPLGRRMSRAGVFAALIVIAVSGSPLPYWFYAGAIAATLAGTVARADAKWTRLFRAAAVVLWLAALAVEIPFHFTPTPPMVAERRLFVIGDSVSAGMGEGKIVAWPKLFAEQHGVAVEDFSQMGATVESALRQADRASDKPGLVLLEIGGNDVLGTTTTSQFDRSLDQLLFKLQRPDRALVMFELPFPPFFNAFGEIQRRLAKKHRVVLLPKRLFLAVLTAKEGTLDGVHLSQAGAQRMADCVWNCVEAAFRD